MKKLNACSLLAFSVLGIAGCGGGVSDAPSVAKVSGTVMVDGKPQGGLTVEFHPDSASGTKGPMSTGLTAMMALLSSQPRPAELVRSLEIIRFW
jgi:hypothetical protein